MIFPIFSKIRNFELYPFTLGLLAINICVFFLFFSAPMLSKGIDALATPENLLIAGKVFNGITSESEKPNWAKRIVARDERSLSMMGALALRDESFLRKVAALPTNSLNALEFPQFQKAVKDLLDEDIKDPIFRFGLGTRATTPWAWITYQFSHSEVFHLLSNLVFLWLVGSLVEVHFGAGILMVVYLLGGISGGFLFLLFQDHGFAPVIGASGSISALIAFFTFAVGMRRWPFAYFIAPFKHYYGVIYLPALVLLPLYLISDLSQLLSTPDGLATGVAHAAHVGGALYGAATGSLYYLLALYRRKTST